VIVVGAGPCGATAAYFLAKPEQNFTGKSVALLDKATFPRDKYCGDAWCSPALDILEEMQVLQSLEAQGLIQDCTAGGFVSPSGESFISTGENSSMESGVRCYAIKRIICDEAIVRRAEQVGAQLFENADCERAVLETEGEYKGKWAVTCRDGRVFRSKILIAADGAASQLSRSLGIVNDAPDAMASRQYIKGGTHNFKSGGVLFYPDYALPGYVAIFRHYNDDIDVGVYLLEEGATKPEDILQVSIDAVARDPFMQRIIGKNAVALERPRVASIRTGGVEKSYAVQFMAVGDAAGQTDPLTGEGIHTGMIGSKIAAQTIHEMFDQNNFSEAASAKYHKRWIDDFGKDFPVSKFGAKLTYKIPLFLDAANVVAQRKGDAFMADFGAAMTGVKPKSIFLRPAMSFPLTAEVVRQFFIQKILRPYKSMRHAYDMRSIEKDTRDTAFNNSCIVDSTVPIGIIDLDPSSNSDLENLFRFESTDPKARNILVLFASEYGFAQESALAFCEALFNGVKQKSTKKLNTQPLNVRYLNAKHHEIINWSEIDSCVLMCATAGDGDPPQTAKCLFSLFENEKPSLNHCDFILLAMGDSAYPNYCAAGMKLQALMLSCGANEILPITKINSENHNDLQAWQSKTIEKFSDDGYWENKIKKYSDDGFPERAQLYFSKMTNEKPKPSLKNPFVAKLKSQTLTTNPELGGKETFHICLDATPETTPNTIPDPESELSLEWKAGDALAVLPCNPNKEVECLISLLNFIGVEKVMLDKNDYTLLEALKEKCDIKNVSSILLNNIFKTDAPSEQLSSLELQDLVKQQASYFKNVTAQELVDSLSKLSPRYYSIASNMSNISNKNQSIDLCVASQTFIVADQQREGVASYYLNKQLKEQQTLKVFVHANEDFRLPKENSAAACVMIGAGTGIAPYRAFLQSLESQSLALQSTELESTELESTELESSELKSSELKSSENRNLDKQHLLFFGCRHQAADYLYQEELEAWQTKGLVKLFNAFSRDQVEKVYVQHKLLEQAELIWKRMELGDHFYICGDATYMAGDVEAALLQIIQEQGQLHAEQAEAYLTVMAKAGRYQKDVWI
jgi:sulfite reductase alpha subunit-like flavoprotein/flavin-dependent dehydrogenase